MALRDILASFTVNVSGGDKLKKTDTDANVLKGTLEKLGGVLAAGALVNGVKGFVTGMADAADQINDTSAQLGLATTEFQQWSLAAKLSGASASDFGTSIKILQKHISDASTVGNPAAEAFKKLGVATHDASGNMRETTDILGAVGVAISEMPDAADRTAAALELFGKSGTKLLPMFAKGEEGLQDLLAELEKLGGGFSEDALEAMGEMGDNLDRWDVAMNSLKGTIATKLFPTMNSWLQQILKVTGGITKNKEMMDHLKVAFVTLGTVAAAAGIKALLPWLPLMIGLALLVLVVDDLWTAFNGGDAVTKRILDRLFGAGTGTSVFKSIKDEWDDLQKSLKQNPSVGLGEEIFSRAGARIVTELMRIKTDVDEFRVQLAKDVAGWTLGKEVGAALIRAFAEAPAAVKAWISGNIDRFSQLGKDIVDGVKKGIDDAAKSLPEGLVEGLKTTLKMAGVSVGQGSPARKFEPLGESMPDGIMVGHARRAPYLIAQAQQTMAQVHGATQSISNRSVAMQARNTYQVNVHGIGQDAVKRGLLDAAEEDRRATLAALEVLA